MKNNFPREVDLADVRSRILEAATRLITSGGVAALTTRAVAAEAAVQAPTLYRLFGDKRGLLDAVAEHGLAAFVAQKVGAPPHPDPVQELRDAWDAYITFGLSNPAVFAIINEVGRSGPPSPAATAGISVLEARVKRIAHAGRLRLPESRAVALIHAAGTGVVATLLAVPPHERDQDLPVTAREAVFAAVLNDAAASADNSLSSLAVGLRAHLDVIDIFSPGEALLMRELLERIANRTA